MVLPDTQKNLEFSFGDRLMTHGPSDFGSPDPRTAVVKMPIAIPSIIVLKKTAVMFLGPGNWGEKILVAKPSRSAGVLSLSAFLRLLEELSFDAYIITPCNKNPE